SWPALSWRVLSKPHSKPEQCQNQSPNQPTHPTTGQIDYPEITLDFEAEALTSEAMSHAEASGWWHLCCSGDEEMAWSCPHAAPGRSGGRLAQHVLRQQDGAALRAALMSAVAAE